MKKEILFVVIVALSLGSFTKTSAQVNIGDSLALVDLYKSTNGDGWWQNRGWLKAGGIGQWYGVKVSGNRVVELNLTSNLLKGTIPPSIGNLTNLTRLEFSNNYLTGNIPSSIGNLINLNKIVLSRNGLTGDIPSSIGNLTNLDHFEFNQNYLTGIIPSSIGNLTKLKILYLNINRLSGEIPSSIGNLTNLIDLSFSGNTLTGVIPSSIGNLTNLTRLYLNDNQLSSIIPSSIGNLTNLNRLYLYNNQLTGIIPSTIGNLTKLELLYLSSNKLADIIPSQLGNLTNLYSLWLNRNQLTGDIPSQIGNLTNLRVLWIEENKLTGNIPSNIGNLTNLLSLRLNDNQFTGIIPSSIGNLTKLDDLNFSSNKLIGAIPSSIGNLTNLKQLYLFNNLIQDSLPSTMENLRNLSFFNLFNNRLTFKGLENLVKKLPISSSNFKYAPQAKIPIRFLNGKLSVSVGGSLTNNSYRWYGPGIDITIIGDSTFTPPFHGKYNVEVSNAIVKGLVLKGDTTSISLLNPYPAMTTATGTLQMDVNKIDDSKLVKGAATDGVSKILLYTTASNAITFRLASKKDGTIAALNGSTNNGLSVTIQPVNGKIVAVYTAPDGYGFSSPANQRDIIVKTQSTVNASDSGSVAIQLVTPPVVLVHGMWSKPQVWMDGNFQNYLINNGCKNVYLVDYQKYNTQTFDPTNPESLPARDAIFANIKKAIADALAQKIIVTQVDIVGHSLGGLQARSFAQDARFINPIENYNQGYYHKLITIGTPHLGSQWGKLLYDANTSAKYIGYFKYVPIAPVRSIGRIADLVYGISNLFVGSCHADFNPAFKNTRRGLDNLNETKLFKVHAVEARWDYPGSGKKADGWSQYLSILNDKYQNKTAIINASIETILKDTSSDMIVARHSQLAGLTDNNYFSHYDFTTHSDLHVISGVETETTNPLIHKRVRDLLITDDPKFFAKGFPAPKDVKSPYNLNVVNNNEAINNVQNNEIPVPNNSLLIVSPTANTNFVNNGLDSITLRLTFTDSTKLANALFVVSNVGFISAPAKPPFLVKIAVPKNAVAGRMRILALGNDINGNVFVDTLGVFIRSNDTLKSIVVNPMNIRLDSINRVANLNVTGLFRNKLDSTNRDLTLASTGTLYIPKYKDSIINISSDGSLFANRVGKDTIQVVNSGFTVKVPVDVDSSIGRIVKLANTITAYSNNKLISNPPFLLNATVTSGEKVNYTLLSGPVQLNNDLVVINGTGTVKILASSSGNAYFQTPQSKTITFDIVSSSNNLCPQNYWIGNVDDRWENPENWSCLIVPSSNQIVSVEGGKLHSPVIRSQVICKKLQLQKNSGLVVATGFSLKVLE